MVHHVERAPLACDARTHLVVDHDRFIRMRCTDKKCPAVQYANANGLRAYHVWDLEQRLDNGGYRGWNEYESAPSRLED